MACGSIPFPGARMSSASLPNAKFGEVDRDKIVLSLLSSNSLFSSAVEYPNSIAQTSYGPGVVV